MHYSVLVLLSKEQYQPHASLRGNVSDVELAKAYGRIESACSVLMAPFQENNMGDCPRRFMEFEDRSDEVADAWEYEEEWIDYEGKYYKSWDTVEKEGVKVDFTKMPKVTLPNSKAYKSKLDMAEAVFGYELHDGVIGQWYNFNSQWDYWLIGGRWTGFLGGMDYDFTKDPRNMEKCFLCEGSGTRTDTVGVEMGFVDKVVDDVDSPRHGQKGWCNGCEGSGTKLKSSQRWAFTPHNFAPVADLTREHITSYVLTPDGQWLEAEGWAGPGDSTKDTFEAILEEWPGTLAVVLDCHT